jgi:hypothetical protein
MIFYMGCYSTLNDAIRGSNMKTNLFVTVFLVISFFACLHIPAVAAEITLKEDADLFNDTGKSLMTIKSGEKFSFDRIDGDWVFGSYMHDAGIIRGKIKADAFKEQPFLKLKTVEFEKKMAEKGLAKYEGKWIPFEEKEQLENEAKGLIKFEDKWMTTEERDKILAQREEEKKAAEEAAAKEEAAKKASEDKSGTTIPEDAGKEKTDEAKGEEPFPGIEDTTKKEEPAIEDKTEKKEEGSEGTTGETAKEKSKKTIDYNKSRKKTEEDVSEERSSVSPATIGKIVLPAMIGLAVVMVLIVVLSSRKGKHK